MDPVTVAILAQIAEQLLALYLQTIQKAGMTPEQEKALYDSVKAKFLLDDPTTIKDPLEG